MGTSYQKRMGPAPREEVVRLFPPNDPRPGDRPTKTAFARVILGLKTEMSKFQAREKLECEISRLGGQPTGDKSMINGAVTFGWFVNHRYLPLKEADWREETAKVKKHIIKADLVDRVRGRSIGKLRQVHPAEPPQQAGQNLIPRIECCRFGRTCGLSLPRRSIRTSSRKTLRVR